MRSILLVVGIVFFLVLFIYLFFIRCFEFLLGDGDGGVYFYIFIFYFF